LKRELILNSKKFNHHDSSTFPHAQKDKLMKAEIAGELKDNIQTGKLPTTEGVKTLQYVTDTIKKNDDIPVSHKPRWMSLSDALKVANTVNKFLS
jgi:hypothetical protein